MGETSAFGIKNVHFFFKGECLNLCKITNMTHPKKYVQTCLVMKQHSLKDHSDFYTIITRRLRRVTASEATVNKMA